jgi:hypothetical protein
MPNAIFILTITLSFLFGTGLNHAQVSQEPSTTADAQPGAGHLIGKWICNNDPADVYDINPDKTAQHFHDKGSWQIAENLLTIAWENGYRLSFDTTQGGPRFIGLSYPPGKTDPDKLIFTRENTPAPPVLEPLNPAVTLPAERTLTSADGRQMAGTVLAKTDAGIKFRRASDGRAIDIPLDKLSADDRSWVDKSKNKPVAKALLYKLAKEPDLTRLIDYMESKEIEVTLMAQEPSRNDTPRAFLDNNPERPWVHYDEINPADYDIAILGGSPHYKRYDRVGMIIAYNSFHTKKEDLLAGKDEEFDENLVKRPRLTVSENFIFYHCYNATREKENDQVFEHHFKVVDTALELALRRKPAGR